MTIAEFRKRKRQLRLLRARSGRIGRVVTRPIPDLEIRICGKAGGHSQLPLVLYPEHGRESIPLTYPLPLGTAIPNRTIYNHPCRFTTRSPHPLLSSSVLLFSSSSVTPLHPYPTMSYSPIHKASLVESSTHSQALLELVDQKLSRPIIGE